MAPVFTVDEDIDQTIYVLRKWIGLIPGLPVQFIIPYQSKKVRDELVRSLAEANCEFIQCAPDIASTTSELTCHCSNEAWALWLTSDRYPTATLTYRYWEALFEKILADGIDAIAVKLARWREASLIPPSAREESIGGIPFQRMQYSGFGFWHPHFIRPRTLSEILSYAVSDSAAHPAEFNHAIVEKSQLIKGDTLFPARPLVKLEEPVVSGATTVNYMVRREREKLPRARRRKQGRLIAAFSSPHSKSVNRFWQVNQDKPISAVSGRPPDCPVRVASFGGVGSKLLTKAICHSLGVVDSVSVTRSHVHYRLPPAWPAPSERLVYVFGDPRDSIVSFFQRRHQRHARHGFRETTGSTEARPDWAVRMAENLEVDPQPMNAKWDLAAYLEHGADLFRLEEHFDFWLYSHAPYTISFVRYDDMWGNENRLARVLGLPGLQLPDAVPRNANWRELPDEQRAAINRIYGAFAGRLNSLPSVFTVCKNRFVDQISGAEFAPSQI